MIIVMNAWQIFYKGGPMMWPILLLSILTLAIGINRLIVASAVERKLAQARQVLFDVLRQGRLKDALKLCDEHPGPLSNMLKSGIAQFGSPRESIKAVMGERLDNDAARLKDHMGMLGVIINAAPLMGLLGTVNAMTVVFHAVQVRSSVLSPLTAVELSSGIWQALLTTSAGLTVGIMGYAVYSFCSLRINRTIAQLERSMQESVDILHQLAELRKTGEQPYEH